MKYHILAILIAVLNGVVAYLAFGWIVAVLVGVAHAAVYSSCLITMSTVDKIVQLRIQEYLPRKEGP